MRRYLPLVVLVTCLVTVAPAVLVATIAPRAGALVIVVAGASAVALSTAFAAAAAALWKRQPRSRDILFADLLLWGWARRCWTERRLSRAQELYDSARRAGPGVSIELLAGLGRLLEARDAYTHGHGQRVARHSARIARAMHLPATEIAKIRAAAAVHDVGKLYTPREILNNPGRLNAAEFEVVKRHAAEGGEMLAGVGDPEIAAMVRHHHERIDGHGYPDGLAGSEIPLGARIIAVADTFDAITSNRAYRGAGTQKQALQALTRGAGTQLDASAVAAFRHRYSDRRTVASLALATAVAQRLVLSLQAASQGLGGGVSSILPALGAAGVIGISAAPHHHPPLPARRAAAVAHPRAATPAPGAIGRSKRAVGIRPHALAPNHRTRAGSPPVRTPRSSPLVVHVRGGSGPPSGTPGPSSTTRAGPQGPPSPPTVRVRPERTVPPPAPPPPVNPVTPPSPEATIPAVTVPAVPPVPTVTVPPVPSLPSVTVPPHSVPSTGVTVGG
jgi:HD-GYP domain-containing protein (c-di-GMP phosphodiesterase class II)